MIKIYCITNIKTNKKYIGKTKRSVLKRFKEHLNDRRSNRLFANTLHKYSKNDFVIEEIFNVLNGDANFFEKYFIQLFNTKYPFGYNLTSGGDGLQNCTEITKEKMRKSKLNNTYRRNKKWSLESRINFSKIKGYYRPILLTNIITGQQIRFELTTQVADFLKCCAYDVTRCCRKDYGRKSLKGYKMEWILNENQSGSNKTKELLHAQRLEIEPTKVE